MIPKYYKTAYKLVARLPKEKQDGFVRACAALIADMVDSPDPELHLIALAIGDYVAFGSRGPDPADQQAADIVDQIITSL